MQITKFNKIPARHCLMALKDHAYQLETAVPEFFETKYPELTKEERLETLQLAYKLAGLGAERLEQDWERHSREPSYPSSETRDARHEALGREMEEVLDLFTRLGLYLLRLERQKHSGNGEANKVTLAV